MVFTWDLATGWKVTSERRDALLRPAQFDLLGEQLLSGAAVLVGFVGMTNCVLCCEIGRWGQLGLLRRHASDVVCEPVTV
ncbi:MAG: hypothetical protein JJD93_05450 [Ilumatobacteraceae bacterium]|nr:hypothetical protein [Ilumatobacteraceae bacterium]